MASNQQSHEPNEAVIVRGRFPRIARLEHEYFVVLEKPCEFGSRLRETGVDADIFTFTQGIHEPALKFPHVHTVDSMAVLPVSTYDHWLNQQINFKPRNKLRKALKNGVEVRRVPFSDELVKGIMEVYNESPIRQGQRNFHFGKDFATIKREHDAFLDRSDFIVAYHQGKIIGFAKIVHCGSYSVLMKIVSMISQRDKAPTNALIAKAVEICAEKKMAHLTYSVWGKRPGLNEFKEANGFKPVAIPRYFVPLNGRGKMALKLGMHRPFKDRIPDKIIVLAADWREKWTKFKYRDRTPAMQPRTSEATARQA